MADLQGIWRRLRAIRIVSGLDQTACADALGVSASAWREWESGRVYIVPPVEVAIRLTEMIHGLELNWIYTGMNGYLPMQLHRDLLKAGGEGEHWSGIIADADKREFEPPKR